MNTVLETWQHLTGLEQWAFTHALIGLACCWLAVRLGLGD